MATDFWTRRDNDSPPFRRLQELFNPGAPVRAMASFYRGALISWHEDGLFELLVTNLIDKVWGHAARWSTWTGSSY
jgi:hypothetical protein